MFSLSNCFSQYSTLLSIECFYYGTISSFTQNTETVLMLTIFFSTCSYPLIVFYFVDNILHRKVSFKFMQKCA